MRGTVQETLNALLDEEAERLCRAKRYERTEDRKEQKYERNRNGSANIYADLGITDAGEMLVKAQLATKIAEIIKHRRITQVQAAELLGMPQPKLSNMLRGRFRGISEAKMLDCLTKLGRDVQIVIKTASRLRKTGHVSVLSA